MMLFAVISDIHGCATALERALDLCENTFHADCYLLLGDVLYHGPRNRIADGYNAGKTSQLLNSIRGRVIAVRGNCDAEVDQMMLQFPITADCNQIPFCGHRIFMTHGHLYDPSVLPLEKGDLFLSGHTHRVRNEVLENGVRCFNPGSLSLPKEPSYGTFAVLDEKSIRLINLDTAETVIEQPLWN